jgi:putative flippase GtrA
MISRQFLVFLAVGFTSAVIDVGVMQLLIKSGVHYGLSTSLGFSISLIFNFFCQARITFKAVNSFATVVRFGCLVGMNYIITMSFVIFSQYFFGEALFGKVLSLPVIAVNSFLWSRYWVFSQTLR